MSQEITVGNMYDINKQLMSSQKPLTQLEIPQKQTELENWFIYNCDKYAMLLCHERRDYTVFHLCSAPRQAAAELIDCLLNRGDILAIDPTRDGAYEIWLRIDGEEYCYYLFDYTAAVIEV